jgi:GH15 family glucan-1,4-alpha-glucosidase
VLYGIRGEHDTPQHECKSFTGYRGSTPVRIGNHAFKQFQLDAFGYFAICVYDYLKCGGPWRQEFWTLAKDVANFVTANWHRESNGIWELPKRKHFLSGRVMSWAALDRIVKLSQILGKHENIARWQQTMDVIHADVMSRGWSDRLQSFRQHYDHDSLDAAALLIPLVGFLPPEHPRVISTVERIAERLTINGFVYRFDPQEMQIDIFEGDQNPMGEFEGAFVPCTFWLATAYAKMGRLKEATGIVSAVEEIAGTTGLLAEGIDPRQNTFSGNFPLLFSHAEHLRTIKEIEYANRR